jgi:hypothetical protein
MCFELDIQKYGNELNAQKSLIMQFLQFAVKNDCIVHLVAHSRKMSSGNTDMQEDDVYGSSMITNLVHRLFTIKRIYQKEKDKTGEDYDLKISILKDRILGVSRKEIGLYYDVPSRRIYGDNDDLNKKFSWETDSIKYQESFGSNGQIVGNTTKEEEEQFGKELHNISSS